MEYVMALSRLIATAISVYTLLIWIRVMLTWVRIPDPYFSSSPLLRFLSAVVDPFLGMFGGIRWMRWGSIDFSPIMGLMVLSICQSIFSLFGTYGRITPAMVASIVIQGLWGYILSPLFWFALILLGFRLFYCYHRSSGSIMAIQILDNVGRGLFDFVQRLFFGHKAVGMRLLVWTSFLFYLALYIALRYGVSSLSALLVRL